MTTPNIEHAKLAPTRLIQEAKRMGFSEDELADLMGWPTTAQPNPKRHFGSIANMAVAGFDVGYVLSGRRTDPFPKPRLAANHCATYLEPAEAALIAAYRASSSRERLLMELVADVVAAAAKAGQ